MSQYASNTSTCNRHLKNKDHLKDMDRASATHISSAVKNKVFLITSVMLYFL